MTEHNWELIPEDKISHYLDNFLISTVMCECGKLHKGMFIPYAYDKDNNDVIFISKCKHCNQIIYIKE